MYQLRHLKEELVLAAIDKWFQAISDMKNKAVLSEKQYCMSCYVVLNNVIYDCGILIILYHGTVQLSCWYLILYHYNEYTLYKIFSTWFLDILVLYNVMKLLYYTS